MKGTNTLRLNEATMVEAVQRWLNATMLPTAATLVKSITYTTESNCPVFDVRVEGTEEKK